MKKFIVSIEGSTPEQEAEFRKWLGDCGYWHWIPNFWIIADSSDQFTYIAIRDKVVELFPTMNNIVIELKSGHLWSGYGPGGKTRNMFTWLNKNL